MPKGVRLFLFGWTGFYETKEEGLALRNEAGDEGSALRHAFVVTEWNCLEASQAGESALHIGKFSDYGTKGAQTVALRNELRWTGRRRDEDLRLVPATCGHGSAW
jgi:hypothetical protein